MKNRLLFLFVLFFIGGILQPLFAMLPKKTGEEFSRKQREPIRERQGQKMSDAGDDDSSSNRERGERIDKEEENSVDHANKLIDISLIALTKKFKDTWAGYDPNQKYQKELALRQSVVETNNRREKALEEMRQADMEERNEIGETCNAIARKLEVIQNHLRKAAEAYAQGDDSNASSFEAKAAILEGHVSSLQQHLNFLRDQMAIWKRDYQTEESRYLERQEELQADGTKLERSIYKTGFTAPLLLIEKRLDVDGRVLGENKIAAEDLMVELNREEYAAETFVNKLREDFPDSNLSIEEVSRRSSLYSLHFEPSASDNDPAARLNLFANIKKTIEVKNLAVNCYPNFLLGL